MSEQKDNIKNGKNVELDGGVTVRNDLSVAEKQEEKKPEEEAKNVEASSSTETDANTEEKTAKDEIKPDVVVTPEVDVAPNPSPVEPVIPEVSTEQAVQTPVIPIDIDAISSSIGSTAPSETPSVGIDLSTNQANDSITQTPTQEYTTPVFNTPSVQNDSVNVNGFGSFPGYENNSSQSTMINQDTYDNNSVDMNQDFNDNHMSSDPNLFNDVYASENLNEKVTATIVTAEDEKNARSANLKAYADLYDLGPGKQISILRHFSEEAAKWVKAADKSGFVSGEMHDMARKILREYEGLKSDENQFSDDNISFQNNYSQPISQFSNDYQNSNDSKIIPFESSNTYSSFGNNNINQDNNGLKKVS